MFYKSMVVFQLKEKKIKIRKYNKIRNMMKEGKKNKTESRQKRKI